MKAVRTSWPPGLPPTAAGVDLLVEPIHTGSELAVSLMKVGLRGWTSRPMPKLPTGAGWICAGLKLAVLHEGGAPGVDLLAGPDPATGRCRHCLPL